MFIRTSTRRNSVGVPVRYVHLAHNTWDPATKSAKMTVLHSFGREDDLDVAAIKRLIASLTKLTGPAPSPAGGHGGGLELVCSRAIGATWALDGLWHRLGIDTALRRLLVGTRRDAREVGRVERVLFALVAARAIEPASKLATAAWLGRRTWITDLTDHVSTVSDGTADATVAGAAGAAGAAVVSDDECYRAMDWLIDAAPAVEEEVFHAVVDLLELEVDLLFFDTTSTYFETDADEPVARDERGRRAPQTRSDDTTDPDTADSAAAGEEHAGEEHAGEEHRAGFRTWGKSKDSRGDLPQIVIGMAVTRSGIPVRVWSWPGNTADSALIRQAKTDLKDWTLSKIVWVGDRGFTSAANRRDLRAGGHGYILGEKIRTTSADATAALARAGRYQVVADNLHVKEVKVRDDERFIVCFNPDTATRDAAIRQVMVTRLEAMIAGSDTLSATKRGELAGKISMMPGPNRYLRRTPGGLLRLDKQTITAETKLDGKYLLRTSEATMSTQDIALGYKQLAQVERGWRDLKTHLELRPVYHRLERRIRAHVLLCWLSLLLIRVIENETGHTWASLREDLQDLHVIVAAGHAGTFAQTTTPTKAVRTILAALHLDAPRPVLHAAPAREHDADAEATHIA